MALEDAIALAAAVTGASTRDDAFETYVVSRQGPMSKLASAAQGSFDWYERFSEKLDQLPPAELALSFLRRTGRIGDERMVRDFPNFLAYAAARGAAGLPAAASQPHRTENANA